MRRCRGQRWSRRRWRRSAPIPGRWAGRRCWPGCAPRVLRGGSAAPRPRRRVCRARVVSRARRLPPVCLPSSRRSAADHALGPALSARRGGSGSASGSFGHAHWVGGTRDGEAGVPVVAAVPVRGGVVGMGGNRVGADVHGGGACRCPDPPSSPVCRRALAPVPPPRRSSRSAAATCCPWSPETVLRRLGGSPPGGPVELGVVGGARPTARRPARSKRSRRPRRAHCCAATRRRGRPSRARSSAAVLSTRPSTSRSAARHRGPTPFASCEAPPCPLTGRSAAESASRRRLARLSASRPQTPEQVGRPPPRSVRAVPGRVVATARPHRALARAHAARHAPAASCRRRAARRRGVVSIRAAPGQPADGSAPRRHRRARRAGSPPRRPVPAVRLRRRLGADVGTTLRQAQPVPRRRRRCAHPPASCCRASVITAVAKPARPPLRGRAPSP